MSLTSRAIRTEVQNFLDYLLQNDLAIVTRPVVDVGGRVTWRAVDDTVEFLPHRGNPTPLDYRHWVEIGAFSVMLNDGALLQMTYDCSAGSLTGHRLAYVPCPFDVEETELLSQPLVDLIDVHAAGDATEVVLQSVIRFDFDPRAADFGHPAIHFSVNASHCRIACIAPIRVGGFVDFVFRHFYPDLLTAHPYLSSMPTRGWGGRTMSDDESTRHHLAWRV